MSKLIFIFNVFVLGSWLIAELFKIEWFLGGAGLFLLFLLADNLRRLLRFDDSDIWKNYLINLTLYFFVIVPFFWLIGRLGIKYNAWWFLILNILLFGFNFWKNEIWKNQILNVKKWLKENYLILLTLLVFVVLHKLFFVYYFTIPEWDGYSNILDIRKLLANWDFSFYRPFFNTSVMLMTLVSGIDPYILFSTILVWIQSTLSIVVFLLIKNKKIGNFLKFAVLLTTISVPVLNMEIDVARPQGILVMFMSIFIWLLTRYETQKTFLNLLLIILVAVLGLGYHELFLTMFILVSAILIFKILVWFLKLGGWKDKLIFVLIFLLGFTWLNSFFTKIQPLSFLLINIKNFWHQIANFHWRWWFLDNYGTDGLNIGWSGLDQVAKFYGYYMSPIVVIIFIWLILNFRKIKDKKNQLSVMFTVFLMILFLMMSEFFPRLGFVLLPERCWIFFDIVVIILFSLLIDKKNEKGQWWFLLLILLSSLIGIFGSIYIAKEKKSLTDKEEYKAALWIKENTKKDALFVSQVFNNKMIEFFGERKMMTENKDYFMSNEITINSEALNLVDEKKLLEDKKKQIELKLKTADLNKININGLIQEMIEYQNKMIGLNESIKLKADTKIPDYILFSLRKFNNLYSQRSWWKEVGYFGADLDKFNKVYDLVYNHEGIFIWKIK